MPPKPPTSSAFQVRDFFRSPKSGLAKISKDLVDHKILLAEEQNAHVKETFTVSFEKIGHGLDNLQREVNATSLMKLATRSDLKRRVNDLRADLEKTISQWQTASAIARANLTEESIVAFGTVLEFVDEYDIKLLIAALLIALEPEIKEGKKVYTKMYKNILHCQDSSPQQLVNFLQWILDTARIPDSDSESKGKITVALQRLAADNNVYPECYLLKGAIGEKIAVSSGSFGDVFKANYEKDLVALKVLKTERKIKNLKDFPREAILWSQLSHRNLLPILGLLALDDPKGLCFVSPWQLNGDIITFLKNNQDADRIRLALDVASGLKYLNENDVIHGDLKGNNILVDQQGRALLADFGLSEISASYISYFTGHSQQPSVGAMRWRAPELFNFNPVTQKTNNKTHASDIYAWSMLCVEMFTGNVPYPYITDADRHCLGTEIDKGKRPAKPEETSAAWLSYGLTDAMWALMEISWDHDPTKRPSAAQLVAQLSAMSQFEDAAEDTATVLLRDKMRGKLNPDYVQILRQILGIDKPYTGIVS